MAARLGVDIADATNPIYTLGADDVNATVRVVIIASNPDGTADRRQHRDRHDPQRRARQHRQADRQRYHAARVRP